MGDKTQSILIVEDDPVVAEALRQTLADMGYDVSAIASSAEEALWHVSKWCPDVVLMDIGITGPLDGIDAAQVLRSRYAIPVIYLTGRADAATWTRAQETEPYGYLRKPVTAAELGSALELALYKRDMETRGRDHEPPSSPSTRSGAPASARPPTERAEPVPRGGRRSTVLLADDHAMLREGLAKLLTEHDFDVVATVPDGDQLLDAARRLRPDVIVTDISMPPGPSGLDILPRLKAEHIDSKVVVLTMHNDTVLATRATRAGAFGFLLKHSAGEELVAAIHHALQGKVYLTPEVTRGVMEQMSASSSAPAETTLTPRQLDVLRLIVAGLRMKEIAAALDLSTRTVETHKYQMMSALGVESTAELVKYALEHRLIAE